MPALYIVCGLLLAASFFADRKKTVKALRIALKKLMKILPAFGLMLILISIVLYLIPEKTIVKYLGNESPAGGIGIAALIGSVAMFPGFIAFPLCGILVEKGVQWSVIAAFSTSLMLVGVVSFPIERRYLGFRIAFIRNIIAFIMSLVIAGVIGTVYGEFF